jgi:hypothetical protein
VDHAPRLIQNGQGRTGGQEARQRFGPAQAGRLAGQDQKRRLEGILGVLSYGSAAHG